MPPPRNPHPRAYCPLCGRPKLIRHSTCSRYCHDVIQVTPRHLWMLPEAVIQGDEPETEWTSDR